MDEKPVGFSTVRFVPCWPWTRMPTPSTWSWTISVRIRGRPSWNALARKRVAGVESVHGALQAQARQLVEPSRNRHQPVLRAMLGPTPNPRTHLSTQGNSSLEPPHEPSSGSDPMGIYSPDGQKKHLATQSRGHGTRTTSSHHDSHQAEMDLWRQSGYR